MNNKELALAILNELLKRQTDKYKQTQTNFEKSLLTDREEQEAIRVEMLADFMGEIRAAISVLEDDSPKQRGAILYENGKWFERVNQQWVEIVPTEQDIGLIRAFGFINE